MSYSKKRRNQNSGSILPGLIITAALLVLNLVFDFFLFRSRMIPTRLFLIVVVVLFAVTAVVYLLVFRSGRRRFIAGVVLAVILAAGMVYGIVALGRVTDTLEEITTPKVEVTHMGVYVLTDDPAETLNDLQNDTFGILAEIDRSSTDEALRVLDDAFSATVTCAEYDGPEDLMDALYGQACRAVVLNAAYIDVLADIDGYEDVESRTREVTSFDVEEIVEEPELGEEAKEEESEEGDFSETTSDTAFTIYVSGIDSRNGLTARSRSDVNILLTVNTETHQMLMVSTPRDYYVPLSISGGARDKLTHAGIYGVNVSMDTLGMLYDVDVDYYFRVSFEGFRDIVDALGGVNVYSEYSFTASGYSFTQGYNYVNGTQALAFARERHAFADGDRQRGRNQMEIIRAIINKALSPSILLNYGSVLTAAEDNFTSDVPYDLIAALVNDQLATGASWNIVSYSVDGSDGRAVPYSMSSSAYVMYPDESTVATASDLMQKVLKGEQIAEP